MDGVEPKTSDWFSAVCSSWSTQPMCRPWNDMVNASEQFSSAFLIRFWCGAARDERVMDVNNEDHGLRSARKDSERFAPAVAQLWDADSVVNVKRMPLFFGDNSFFFHSQNLLTFFDNAAHMSPGNEFDEMKRIFFFFSIVCFCLSATTKASPMTLIIFINGTTCSRSFRPFSCKCCRRIGTFYQLIQRGSYFICGENGSNVSPKNVASWEKHIISVSSLYSDMCVNGNCFRWNWWLTNVIVVWHTLTHTPQSHRRKGWHLAALSGPPQATVHRRCLWNVHARWESDQWWMAKVTNPAHSHTIFANQTHSH